METRRHSVFLSKLLGIRQQWIGCVMLCAGISLTIAPAAHAQQVGAAQNTPPPIIDPNVQRRTVDESDIDSENFEITPFAGFQTIEDFGNDVVYGVRLGYHVSESFFVEAAYGAATAGTTSFEELSGGAPFLTDEERDFVVYDLSLGYNFNGEIFFADGVAFNTDFYVLAGGGGTDFGGDERFTLTLGAGYRVLLTDYLSLRLDVRDHIFNSDLIGEEKSTHNMAYTLGVSVFF
ncbi:outer membrane beta-barrel domain-containing protein [Alteromonas sp. ASW11-36]|uniref:Outer membrane beta-barrel domain-containing protein n=1 Tax=Alteromonas arenosi TaxID=3055817 RepID=A0ABT7T0T4_9ALTE|nr:outer membrane beta-barrel domain-containing protein [Alteromonas sp. ASW11-36]MDM7862021.1 outer membrane beta-barrel domain-containing protein [Alteromonas sp. ASW11-36]